MINSAFKIYLFFLIFICSCKIKKDSLSNLDRFKNHQVYFQYAEKYKQGSEIQQQYIDSALLVDSLFSQAWFEKSVWFVKTGNYYMDSKYIDMAVKIDPQNHLGYKAWKELYIYRDYERCIASIKVLDSILPNTVSYPWGENQYYLTGIAKRQLNKFEDAIIDFTECIEIDGVHGEDWVDPYVYVYRGLCFRDQGLYDLAVKDLKKSIEIYDNCSDAYFYLAKIALAFQKEEEALNYLILALKSKAFLKKEPYSRQFDPVYEQMIINELKQLGYSGF